ncbi:MAG: undecaprenyl-diphosphate phosphatase [Tepidisphaeraceae bacterium]
MNDFIIAIILGIVEGLTEFLPVSSTAHIRLAQGLLGVSLHDNFWKLFAVAIQLPAVLAVVVYFHERIWGFLKSFFQPRGSVKEYLTHPVILVGIATVVTIIPAVLAKKFIKNNLESLWIIGGALIVGGVIMAVVDTIFGKREKKLISDTEAAELADQPPEPHSPFDAINYEKPAPNLPIVTKLEQMKPWQAAWIGAVQVLAAIFPGTSRSMCTIAAGQVANLTRAVALEFSFFLSIPIMMAAFVKDMKDSLSPDDEAYIGHALTRHELLILMTGSLASFVVALAVIAWFMAWVRKRGFVPFAIYRVIIGMVVLVVAARA